MQEQQERSKPSSAFREERRRHLRLPIESDATLCLLDTGTTANCRMVDISLEGCRLRHEVEFAGQPGMNVEVAFRLPSAVFRFAGVLVWSAKNSVFGIQFQRMKSDRRKELAAMLEELQAEVMFKAASAPSGFTAEKAAAYAMMRAKRKERRSDHRHSANLSATIYLLAHQVSLPGRMVDVSMSGCKICLPEPFFATVPLRVEVEFILRGIPLRLPGVAKVLHDKHSVGIRFVEITERKRERLALVIDAVAAEAERGTLPPCTRENE